MAASMISTEAMVGARKGGGRCAVDSQGLVRRITVRLTPPRSSGAPAGTQISQTVDFYDFGVAVRVTAPPHRRSWTRPSLTMAAAR